jgi:hypothetical protein
MAYRLAADLVVVIHLAFLVFIAAGAILAWRWRWLVPLHAASVMWSVAIITVGFACPLTGLEKSLRGLAGEEGYGGGFVDRYVEGVVYPESLTPLLRALVAGAVVVGYVGLHRRRVRAMAPDAGQALQAVPPPS